MGERDKTLDALMENIEKINGSEYTYVVNYYNRLGEKENRVLEMISVIIDKNGDIEGYNRAEHSSYFSDRVELFNILNERRK
jgi:hypothetical protein